MAEISPLLRNKTTPIPKHPYNESMHRFTGHRTRLIWKRCMPSETTKTILTKYVDMIRHSSSIWLFTI